MNMFIEYVRNNYGVLIVLATFISRIIFVGFCWSYGTVIVQFKKQYTTISDTELSWIGSIGQSFGGLLAPLIFYFARRYGYRLTFFLSLLTCSISLLISSFISNLHWLLITYSIPYGFANTTIFILGTLISGLYYPVNQHSKHVFVMCIISIGFPIGYHIMGAFIYSSIEQNGWQIMKRWIGFLEFLASFLLGPVFTRKYRKNTISENQYSSREVSKTNIRHKIYFSLIILTWMLGIFAAMSSINNFLLHLQSYLEQAHIPSSRADLWFRLHGLFDGLFRLLIPLFIYFYPIDIIYLFPVSVFSGFIFLLLILSIVDTSLKSLTILPIILFSFTSAVTTSLQYTISHKLFNKQRIEQGYIYHVIITSLGSIVGPIIGGIFLDTTGNYTSIMLTSMVFLSISFLSFILTILLLNKEKISEEKETQTINI